MGWFWTMAIESKMQPFLTAFNKKLGQQLYHCQKECRKIAALFFYFTLQSMTVESFFS